MSCSLRLLLHVAELVKLVLVVRRQLLVVLSIVLLLLLVFPRLIRQNVMQPAIKKTCAIRI